MNPLYHRLACIFAFTGLPLASSAADLIWDADATVGDPMGGTGNWDAQAAPTLWNNAGTLVAWPNTTDTAVFGGTAGTVTLTESINAGALQFGVGGYTLTGGGNLLAFSSGAKITANHATNATTTLNALLAGTDITINPSQIDSTIINASQGGVTLAATSSHTGQLKIEGGMLSLNTGVGMTSGAGITVKGSGIYHPNAFSGTHPFPRLRQGILFLNGTVDQIGTQTITLKGGTLLRASAAGGSDTMTLPNVTLGSGFNTIAAAPTGGAPNGDTLVINDFNRTDTASTVEFRSTYGTLGANGDNGKVSFTNIGGSPVANVNGILGGWAYANIVATNTLGTTASEAFATWDAAALSVKAATPDKSSNTTGATLVSQSLSAALPTDNWLANGVNVNNTITADKTINSLIEQNDVLVNNGATLTLASGGYIMKTSNFWLQSTTNDGKLTSGETNGNLFVNTAATVNALTDLRIRLKIIDNGATPVKLVKTGSGSVSLGAYNNGTGTNSSYTGGTFVQAGRLITNAVNAFSSGVVTIHTGGQVSLATNGTYTNAFVVEGIGTPEDAGLLGAIRFGGTTAVSGTVTLTGDTRFTTFATTDFGTISGVISGAFAVEKTGVGTFALTGANTYSGKTLANAGTLLIGGTNNATTVVVNTGATFGAGTQTLNRGTAGIGGLVANAGGTALFDLSDTTTVGSNVNDLIEVQGNLTLPTTGTFAISINPTTGVLANGTYRLINYSGSLIGNGANLTLAGAGSTRQTLNLDLTTPGQVNLVVAGTGAPLKYTNQSTDGIWNINTSTNWDNGGNPDKFLLGDAVTFEDTLSPAGPYSVALVSALLPQSMTFATNKDITFTGTGTIGGGGALTKSGTGNLNLTGNHTFSGGSTITGGVVKLTNGTSLGSGSITVSGNGAVDLNSGTIPVGQAISLAGAGPDGLGALRNTSATPCAVNTVTLTGDTTIGGGAARWDIGGAGSNVLNGGTFTLTKVGTNSTWFRSNAATTLGNIVINAGVFGVESASDALGSTAHQATVNPGGELSSWGGTSQNKPVTLAGGTLDNDWAAISTWTGAITVNADSTLKSDSGVNSVLKIDGIISGAGGLTVSTLTNGFVEMNAANPYTGPTIVNGGTLRVNGSLTGSATTVGANGALSGTGSISQVTTILAGGNVAPGNPATTAEQFDFLANVNLNTGSIYQATITGATTSDKLNVGGTLAANGTIRVALVGYTPVLGDTFDLADGTITGTPIFDLATAVLPVGLAWKTSTFVTDGTISVVQDPYSVWAAAAGLNGGNELSTFDPDGDGAVNFLEYATNAQPVTDLSGARVYGAVNSVAGSPASTFSFPVRAGATFTSQASKQAASKDGIKYEVEASTDLTDWATVIVTEVTGADATAAQASLPGAGSGYEYHTFKAANTVSPAVRTYMRLRVTQE